MAPEEEQRLRDEWRRLVGTLLPREAETRRDWPIRFDHCFARVLLDNAHGGPWRDHVAPPAWRNTDPAVLAEAVKMGRNVLNGSENLVAFNERSLALRGKLRPRKLRSH